MFSTADPWLAWELFLLADRLHCPKMLEQCQHFLNVRGARFLAASAQGALYLLTVSISRDELSQLHHACVARVAKDFQEVKAQIQQLPVEVWLPIMQVMATQYAQMQAGIVVKMPLKKRTRASLQMLPHPNGQPGTSANGLAGEDE